MNDKKESNITVLEEDLIFFLGKDWKNNKLLDWVEDDSEVS